MNLSRLLRRDDSPTLRERLSATAARLRAVKSHAVLDEKIERAAPQTPEPEPEPVDRVALVNYATWLHFERTRVCNEIYPHMGGKAERFVLTLNAAEQFFYPDGIGNRLSDAWKWVPPPSTRAVQILDLVGVDWRQDLNDATRQFFDRDGRADTGERPDLPRGWPAPDAALATAAGDLLRADAAIIALVTGDDRPSMQIPGYAELDEARGDALSVLCRERARTLHGLQAKAKAILSPGCAADETMAAEIGQSLARDLLGATSSRVIEPRPDPIFAAITECERLEAIAHANEVETPPGCELSLEAKDDASAVWTFIEGTLLHTVPATAAGCAALARFIPPLFKRWGACLDGRQGAGFFDLIARSPLL